MDGAPKISVAVCTYNRAELLRGALQSLVEQSLDKALYEVLVVDNASTDHTSDVVRLFQCANPELEIILVSEARQGLGYARNTGFNNSKGAYVAFMDDDTRSDKNWLKLALDCFEHVRPTPWSVGGPVFPFYDSPKPAWFKDEYETDTWGDTPRFLKDRKSVV